MTHDTADATVIRAGAAATLLVAAGTFLTVQLAPGVGRLPLVAGLLAAAVAVVLTGAAIGRHRAGAGAGLAAVAVAVVVWLTPPSTHATVAVVLVVLGVAELLAAPTLARAGRLGRSAGDWLRRQ